MGGGIYPHRRPVTTPPQECSDRFFATVVIGKLLLAACDAVVTPVQRDRTIRYSGATLARTVGTTGCRRRRRVVVGHVASNFCGGHCRPTGGEGRGKRNDYASHTTRALLLLYGDRHLRMSTAAAAAADFPGNGSSWRTATTDVHGDRERRVVDVRFFADYYSSRSYECAF